MRVLLMTVPETLGNNGVKGGGRTASPPLGIAYIGGVLEKAGYEVIFIDFAARQVTDISEIIRKVKKAQPDLAGVSFMTINANQAFEVMRALKLEVDCPIIAGGPHPTYFPDDTLSRVSSLSAVVIGEGEAVICDLADALINKRPLDKIEGICYRDEQGKIILNESRRIIKNLDEVPYPARHLLDLGLYKPYPFQLKRMPQATMITSRGCPYAKCTFCYSSARKTIIFYRRHSVKRAIEEIKLLIKNYGIREINFLDDDFAMDGRWVNEFCDCLIKEKLGITWVCMARVTSVSKEILLKMFSTGCWSIFFGVESANQHLLERIKKGTTVEQNRNAVKWAHEAGMQVSAAFMMLLPGEVPEDAQRNVRFAKELDIEFVAFGPTRPLVGTPLFEQCRAFSSGELPVEYYKRSGDYFIPCASFIPEGYTKKQALSVCANAYRQYYLRPRYVWHMLKKIKSYADIKRYIECARLFLKLA